MKLSIVTVCFNSEATILDTIKSVNEQTYLDVEHIFVDGGSTDNTCEIIRKNSIRDFKLMSENDNGIYDAMNKGASLVTGDIIVFLNSDDVYPNNKIIELVMQKFKQSIDIVYGDIYFVDENDNIKRVWTTGEIPADWKIGFQIPHPAFFMRTSLIERNKNLFDSKYQIAADLKMQLSLFKTFDLVCEYLQQDLVKMRLGGVSTKNMRAIYNGFLETRSVYNDVNGDGGLIFAIRKLMKKIKKQGRY